MLTLSRIISQRPCWSLNSIRKYHRRASSNVMAPAKPLPYSPEFQNADEYVDSLLSFCAASTVFQTLCGGVHILDFFTRDTSLFHTIIPGEWRHWLMARDSMALLDFLMRDDLASPESSTAPASLLKYVHDIRRHSLDRTYVKESAKDTKLPLHVAVGMNVKKKHEVSSFASYVSKVADSVSEEGREITHFVDFGSGQNYLGRTLASPPYNKHIIAVESKELNISGAKGMDVKAGLAKREKVMRNKKIHRAQLDSLKPAAELNDKALRRKERKIELPGQNEADLRPISALNTIYTPEQGKGYVQYVEHVVKDGNLDDVVEQVERLKLAAPKGEVAIVNGDGEVTDAVATMAEVSKEEELRLMAISIHSCGNLSHHGIRSLLLNPTVHAIAIVGCCYNLLTERFGSTYKLPTLRPNLTAINSVDSSRDWHTADCHGFPMSDRVATYGGHGIQLNITSRMMAVQAPHNWTEKESDSFFTRHFFRALLQRMFLDYGVVKKIVAKDEDGNPTGMENTEAVIIGSLRKFFYGSFKSYVRGALEKMAQDPERGAKITGKMSDITDEEIDGYDERYRDLKKELSVAWSLMAFSAGVVESLIVVDRWLFLREHMSDGADTSEGIVSDCWVEAVFDYSLSPRNLVVVGVKK